MAGQAAVLHRRGRQRAPQREHAEHLQAQRVTGVRLQRVRGALGHDQRPVPRAGRGADALKLGGRQPYRVTGQRRRVDGRAGSHLGQVGVAQRMAQRSRQAARVGQRRGGGDLVCLVGRITDVQVQLVEQARQRLAGTQVVTRAMREPQRLQLGGDLGQWPGAVGGGLPERVHGQRDAQRRYRGVRAGLQWVGAEMRAAGQLGLRHLQRCGEGGDQRPPVE